jgi:chromosome segregation ATPase
MNFLFLSVFICGALSHSLQPAQDASLVEMYKQNPSRFIASMADVDPDQVGNIIAMLEDLKEKSEAEEARLISELGTANRELGEASNAVLDAQGALADAELVRDNAHNDHDAKERERVKREAERDDAQTVVNNEEAALDDEQTVLAQVISLLNGLLPADFVERKSRNLLGLASALSDPSFIAQMAKADPEKVQEIIDMLQNELGDSNLREKTIRDALAAAETALGEASAAVLAADEAWKGAQGIVDDIDRDLASKVEAEGNAQAKKDSAQNVHDAEIGGLNSEQQVLGDVITALRDLLSRQ